MSNAQGKSHHRYRLGLDIGTNSLGWAIFSLNEESVPTGIVKAGVRVFTDGRNPKDGTSLAVTRRLVRQARRRRDRFLARRSSILHLLGEAGLLPLVRSERLALKALNPYQLRAEALDRALTAFELGRALFHLNQRRGFRSSRKTLRKDEAGLVALTSPHLLDRS